MEKGSDKFLPIASLLYNMLLVKTEKFTMEYQEQEMKFTQLVFSRKGVE